MYKRQEREREREREREKVIFNKALGVNEMKSAILAPVAGLKLERGRLFGQMGNMIGISTVVN